MISEKELVHFSPDLNLVEYRQTSSLYEKPDYAISFYHQKEKVRLEYYLSEQEHAIEIAFRMDAIILNPDLLHLAVYYAAELEEYLNHHPKNKIRKMVTEEKIQLSKELQSYLKQGVPYRRWARGFTTEWSLYSMLVFMFAGLFIILFNLEFQSILPTFIGTLLFTAIGCLSSYKWKQRKYEKKYPLTKKSSL